MENAKKFFEEAVKTEEAKALLAAVEKPKTEDECIAAYINVAEKLGVALTEEGIIAYLKASVKEDVCEIDDNELSQLAGGSGNSDGANNGETEENVLFLEGCANLFNDYKPFNF